MPFFISIRTCSHTQYKRSIILLANRKKITSFHLRFVFRLCFGFFQQLHSKTYTRKNSIEIIIFNEQFLGFFMNSFCDSKKWLLFNKVICLVNYRPIFFWRCVATNCTWIIEIEYLKEIYFHILLIGYMKLHACCFFGTAVFSAQIV